MSSGVSYVSDLEWKVIAPGLSYGVLNGNINGAGTRWKLPSKGSVWLWMNEEGSGLVWEKKDRFSLKSNMYAMTGGGEPDNWICLRYPGKQKLKILVMEQGWLTPRLDSGMHHYELRDWLKKGCSVAFCGLMGQWEKELCVALSALNTDIIFPKFIAESKILEWATVRLFRSRHLSQPSPFCVTVRELNPTQRALAILRTRFNEPLDLSSLSKAVGILPHRLSRKVKEDTGCTLQHHLRRYRIENACEYLVSGKSNVTKTAFIVGYRSLSHFVKAFRIELGMTPKEWVKSNK